MFVPRDGSPFQKCYRCGAVKPAGEFNWRHMAGNRRDSFCRPCRSAYKKEHYARNKQKYIDNAAARKRLTRRKRTEYLIAFFKAHPCLDCGETDPVVLEFDHIGDNKLFEVTQHLAERRWDDILAEMEKCEVVCANCHRRRTCKRRRSLRVQLTEPVDAAGSE